MDESGPKLNKKVAEISEDTSIEKVGEAVIRFNGKNFVASNHAKAREMIEVEYGQVEEDKFEAYGFLTSKGRIVTEKEAIEMMISSGQIKPEEIGEQEFPLSERLKVMKEYPDDGRDS